MSKRERTTHPGSGTPNGGASSGGTVVPLRPHGRSEPAEPPRRRVRIRKLRLLALLLGLTCLAAVSTVFGMMMAVASDLPTLEEPADRTSVILDRSGRSIGVLTGNQKRILLSE